MTNNEVIVATINVVRSEVDKLLSEKTNWGRNDLKMRLEQLYTSSVMKTIISLDAKKINS